MRSGALGAGVAGSDLESVATFVFVTGVMLMPSRDSLLRCILSCVGVDEIIGALAVPCITPLDLDSLLPLLGPLARPEGITESNPDLALPLLFLDLSGLLPLDLLPDCLEDLSDISVDGLLLMLELLDLLVSVGLSLGLAPVSLPASPECLAL